MSQFKKFSFLLVYLLVPLPLLGFYLGGIYNYGTFAIIFSLIPFVDYFITDASNPSQKEMIPLRQDPFFRAIVLAYLPIQMAVLILSLFLQQNVSLQAYEWFGFALSTGFVTGGIGITVAHELMHKNGKREHFSSKALLTMVCYGHFFIEHVKGHHVRVATPEDPATARFGETIYQFLPRTIKGSFQSAWALEKKRLQRQGLSNGHRRNQFYWILGLPIAILIGLYTLMGLQACFFFLLQSITAVITLEIVNYIEHYGLQRKKLADGHYEKVSHLHSWDAHHWLSNMVLFHLQRHSDHHAHGGKPYQTLKHIPESPQMPSGYLGMIALALIPPLWRRVMDPKVTAFLQQQAQAA